MSNPRNVRKVHLSPKREQVDNKKRVRKMPSEKDILVAIFFLASIICRDKKEKEKTIEIKLYGLILFSQHI